MKTTLMLAALVILSTVAWGQESTTTFIDKHGNKTSVTASCNSNGDCVVWDSTNDPSAKTLTEIHHEVKAREAFCKAQGIPTSRMSAKKNEACKSAWEQHKLEDVK